MQCATHQHRGLRQFWCAGRKQCQHIYLKARVPFGCRVRNNRFDKFRLSHQSMEGHIMRQQRTKSFYIHVLGLHQDSGLRRRLVVQGTLPPCMTKCPDCTAPKSTPAQTVLQELEAPRPNSFPCQVQQNSTRSPNDQLQHTRHRYLQQLYTATNSTLGREPGKTPQYRKNSQHRLHYRKSRRNSLSKSSSCRLKPIIRLPADAH